VTCDTDCDEAVRLEFSGKSLPNGGTLSESTAPSRRAWVITGVAPLVAIFWIQLALSVHRNSFARDEDDRIYSGNMSWKHGDFGLNPEHPPLVKLKRATIRLMLRAVVAEVARLYIHVRVEIVENMSP
jgi:hypothetical protein